MTVIDDFGHHPTAIAQTLKALRLRYGTQRIWAVFEPRTNTTRRNIFQHELAEAFRDADGVVISQIARLELLKPEERLDPALLMRTLQEGRQEGGVSAGCGRDCGASAEGGGRGRCDLRVQQRRVRGDSR